MHARFTLEVEHEPQRMTGGEMDIRIKFNMVSAFSCEARAEEIVFQDTVRKHVSLKTFPLPSLDLLFQNGEWIAPGKRSHAICLP